MQSRDEYKKRWALYAEGLKGIGWHLPSSQDRERLEKCVKEIVSIVEVAARDIR